MKNRTQHEWIRSQFDHQEPEPEPYRPPPPPIFPLGSRRELIEIRSKEEQFLTKKSVITVSPGEPYFIVDAHWFQR